MRIRKAKLKDAKECVEMRNREEKKWSTIDFISSVSDNHCIFLVAEIDKCLVGYIIGFIVPTQKKEAMLHETRVVKTERGKGIGENLVNTFCREAFRRKVKTIYAEIEPNLVGFYCNKRGFKKNAEWIEVKKEKPNIMDFAGSWKMSDKEADKMKAGLRKTWSRRKLKPL